MLREDRAYLFFSDRLDAFKGGRITGDNDCGRGFGKKIGSQSDRIVYMRR